MVKGNGANRKLMGSFLVSYLTSFESNIISLTIFAIFDIKSCVSMWLAVCIDTF